MLPLHSEPIQPGYKNPQEDKAENLSPHRESTRFNPVTDVPIHSIQTSHGKEKYPATFSGPHGIHTDHALRHLVASRLSKDKFPSLKFDKAKDVVPAS